MSGLEGTTTLPVVGTTKKSYVAVGVVLVAGIVGWAYYRRTVGAAAAADGADGGLYADTRTGSELPTDQYTNPAPGASGAGDDSSAWSAPKTDPEWAQRAIDALSWYEPGFVSATVGKYLARQPLTTSDEQSVIREAWAQIGRPPGNQPIITAPTSGPGTTVPSGTHAGALDIKIVQLHVVGTTRTSVTLDWSTVGRPDFYRIYVNGVQKVSRAISAGTVGGLKAGTAYSFGIAPVKSNVVGPMVSISATTKK